MPIIKFPYRQRASWLTQCIMTDGKNPVPMANLANALIGLESDPFLDGMLAYDAFACTAMMTREVAGEPHEPRKMTDLDVGDIQKFLQHAGLKGLGKDTVHQAVEMHAHTATYHPVLDFLKALVWDSTERVERWLHTYAGWNDTPYTRAVGRMFLIAMIARIFKPGCKADYMIVLEGEQGLLKSTLLNRLSSPWFSDYLPDISTKDAMVHLRGKWLIEIAEMHTFNKAETTALKSFITRRVEQYRPPFGRIEVDEPRQCLFAGTTNKDTYLKDETGGRRFHPGKCIGKIDIDALERDRDQVLAEAVHLYHEGAHWWPDRAFEHEYIEPQQALRYDGDAWEDLIDPWLREQREITLIDVAIGALGYYDAARPEDGNGKTPLNRFGTTDQNRVKAILKNHGFAKSGRRTPGTGRWIWHKP